MYRGGGWREARAIPAAPDYKDASIVQAEWRVLMPMDKDVLMMHYVWKAPSSFICRRLKLKQGRGFGHVWDFALYHAQTAIAQRLDKIEGKFVNKPEIAYTAAQLMTESVS
jgi:toxin CptA